MTSTKRLPIHIRSIAAIITYINLRSVDLYILINNFCSFGKVFASLIVIGGGIYQICIGNTSNLKGGFAGTTTRPGRIALAFYNGLWAYDGWSSVTVISEEIKKPEKYVENGDDSPIHSST